MSSRGYAGYDAVRPHMPSDHGPPYWDGSGTDPSRPPVPRNQTDKSMSGSYLPHLLAPPQHSPPLLPRSLAWKLGGHSLALSMTFILPFCVWLWFIFVRNHTVLDLQQLVWLSTASPTRFLIISTISVSVSKVLVGLTMGLHAFVTASDWIRESDHGHSSKLLTPTQASSAMSLYQGPGTYNLLSAIRTAIKPVHRTPWPPLLRRAVRILAWMIALSYGIAATDLWLHIDAKVSQQVPTSSDFAALGYNSQNTQFSAMVNQSQCSTYTWDGTGSPYLPYAQRAASCGLVDGTSSSGDLTRPIAVQAFTNSSSKFRTAWLSDNTAVLVPAKMPAIGYTARALGVRAQCASITKQCVSCSMYQSDTSIDCDGPNAGPDLACPETARFNLSDIQAKTGDWSSPVMLAEGNGSVIFHPETNPFSVGQIVTSSAYINDRLLRSSDYFVGDTGFLLHGHVAGTNVIKCDLTVMNTLYQFVTPNTYRMLSNTLANTTTAAYVGYGLSNMDRASYPVPNLIDGLGQIPGDPTYAEQYARHLSKWAVASVSYIIGQEPATTLNPGNQSGTQVTLIGMFLLIILDGLMVITVLCVGARATAIVAIRRDPYLKAGRGRLLSVLPWIGDSLGGVRVNPQTAAASGAGQASMASETETDRLYLTPSIITDGQYSTTRLRPARQ